MVNESDATRAYSAEVHILFTGYAEDSETPGVSRVASTIGFVRDGAIRVIIDPGMLPDQSAMLAPLAALGESPTSITDVVFSHHHPDHTLNAALFAHARFMTTGLSTRATPGRIVPLRGMNFLLRSDC